MPSARQVVNSLSLSRIAFGFLFVVSFQRRDWLFHISVAAFALALVTDVLDGYLARRLNVATVHGRMWDSLGDKCFYAGVIVAFNAHGFLGPIVSWGLLVREIALYITRVLFIEKLQLIERIRPWTNWHGYFMYLTIVLGLARMHATIHGPPVSLSLYMQISAYAALAFGILSIVHFLRLR
jgi:CDP-diacylglycerol---glycerol-3-phosphate 3-phosphatidyltransferase